MASLSISKAWDESKRIINRDGKLLVSVALALIVFPAAVLGLLAPPIATEAPPKWVQMVSLLVGLVGIAGQIALIRLALFPATVVGDAISSGFRRLLPTFVALVLVILGLVLILLPIFVLVAGTGSFDAAAAGKVTPEAGRALLLVVLLGFLAIARFQLVTPVGGAEAIGPIKILIRSWELSKGHYWRLLAFVVLTLVLLLILVLFLGQMMGAILVGSVAGEIAPLSVGALVAGLIAGVAQGAFSVIVSVMIARIYAQLAGRVAEPSVPSSGD